MNTGAPLPCIGTLRILANGPQLYVNCEEHNRLVDSAVGLLVEVNFRPDWVISLTNGGAFIGPIIARCFNLNTAYWSASSYDIPASSMGSNIVRRKQVTLAKEISWVSPDGRQEYLPFVLRGNILLVDDLIDSNQTLPAATEELRKRYSDYGQGYTIKTLCLWRKLNPEAAVGKADFVVMDVEPESGTKQVPWIRQYHEETVERIKANYGLK